MEKYSGRSAGKGRRLAKVRVIQMPEKKDGLGHGYILGSPSYGV